MITELTPGTIHLFHSPVAVPDSLFQLCRSTLTEEEIERSNRFHFEKDRSQFLVARGLLRLLLGFHSEISPTEVKIQLGQFGKPFATGGPYFNLAHSGGQILIGLTNATEIGVDIEALQLEKKRMLPLQDRICTPGEIASLSPLAEPIREAALYRLWTAKEAYLKALGTGLQVEPDEIEIEPHILRGSHKASKVKRTNASSGSAFSPQVFPLPECEDHFGVSAAWSAETELMVEWFDASHLENFL